MPIVKIGEVPEKQIRICAEPNKALGFNMPWRSCHGMDTILVSEGVQCVNCGNLVGVSNVPTKPTILGRTTF